MRRNLFLLLGIILLYLVPSLMLSIVYGPSYGVLSGEDCWIPDAKGGWQQHGHPAGPAPAEPSVEIPMAAQYLPLLLPAALLIVFMFTPLSRRLEDPPPKQEGIPPLT